MFALRLLDKDIDGGFGEDCSNVLTGKMEIK